MEKVAVLLTCFNRKNKTLNALKSIKRAEALFTNSLKLTFYLTDDGSTDGTSKAVKDLYPDVNILNGTGSLFWAGGMHNSWKKALNKDYDGYLLLNDDTNVYENVFHQLYHTESYCRENFGMNGIYVGSTQDPETRKLTYGGAILTDKFWFKYHKLEPNDFVQQCHMGNANIMYVSKEVVDKIGTISNKYTHGIADYDYTLKAIKHKIPVLVAPEYCGSCTHDHEDIYVQFPKMKLRERIQLMRSPLGFDWKSYLLFMRRHFPVRVPFVAASMVLKVILPNFYVKNLRNR